MRKLLLIVFLFELFLLKAQNRIEIKGQLVGDNIEIAQLHIYNLQSKKGTISDNQGRFIIKVAVNEVLVVSSIQFSEKKNTVTQANIFSKEIRINLKSEATKLKEVVVNSHNLLGSILLDSKKVPKNFERYLHYRISTEGVNFDAPGNITNPSDIKLPNPLRTSETVNSVDFVNITRSLTSGIRHRRKLKKMYQMRIAALPSEVRKYLGDSFFINKLKIPKVVIDDFLNYCQQKGILRLYLQNKKMELIEKLFIESKNYLKILKDD